MLGIALTYGAKNFTAIMLRSMVYMFVIWLPAVFTLFGLIPDTTGSYLLILPSVNAARLLTAGVSTVAGRQLVFGYLYLVALCAVLYICVVKPDVQRYVVREIGV